MEISLGIDAASLMTIGIALIGLFLFAASLPSALIAIHYLLVVPPIETGDLIVSHTVSVVGIVQTVSALVIFAGAFRVGGLVKFMRTFGQAPD